MRKSCSIIIILLLIGFGTGFAAGAQDKSDAYKEHELKAAFIYNFLKFIDWPEDASAEEKTAEKSEPDQEKIIRLGVIGNDETCSALEVINGKQIKEKKIKVVYLSEEDVQAKEPKSLKSCQVLFFCTAHKDESGKSPSPSYDLKKILALIKDSSILTIGEIPGFLEQSGMINLIVEEKKISFEINLDTLEQAKLKARAQLLKLAKRVIRKEKKEPEQKRDN